MRHVSEIPPVPQWFRDEVMGLLALYPNASASSAAVVAWWRFLHKQQPEALRWAFARAPSSSPNFAPSAAMVLEHAKAWRAPTPRPDFERLALPEHEPELPEEHPMWAEIESIKARQRSGELKGLDVMRAVVHAVSRL